MCAVSFITDHYRQWWSQPSMWTWEQWLEYQELKRKAREYDIKSGQYDCEKTQEIESWEKDVKKHLFIQNETDLNEGFETNEYR